MPTYLDIEEVQSFDPELLPDDQGFILTDIVKQYPSYTYKLIMDQGRIRGMTDGMDAIKQAVYKLLATVAGAHPIYSDNYGLYVEDLIGQDHAFVEGEVARRIKRCMLVDDRIRKASDFKFRKDGDKLSFTFAVTATSGEVATVEGEVMV